MAIVRVKEADLHGTQSPAATAAATSPGHSRQQQQQRDRSPAAASPAAVDEHGVPIQDDRVLQAVQRLNERVKALQAGHNPAAAEGSNGAASGAGAGAAGAAGAGGGGGGGDGGTMGVGLVVDGGALALLLQPQHEDGFLQLAKGCDAVICCRVSPMQKAQVCYGGGG